MALKSEFDRLRKTDGLPVGAVRNLGNNRIGAYGIVFGSKTYSDIASEYFTKSTDELTVIFDEIKALPWLIQHANDDLMKTTPIGVVDHIEIDEVGLYYETRITKQKLYQKYVSRFVDNGQLFTSTGTIPYGREVSKSGEITRWPIFEITGTWIPAQWQMMSTKDPRDVKSVYDLVGLLIPDELNKALANELPNELPADDDAHSGKDGVDVEETGTTKANDDAHTGSDKDVETGELPLDENVVATELNHLAAIGLEITRLDVQAL